MIKPKRLQPGDKIAIVSLSAGILGEEKFIHKYHIAKERLEKDFGLEVVTMPHALKGCDFIYNHPELRAKDLMDAFADTSIKAVFCAIGGDDTIRTAAYIDYDILRNNPKIFMGYSDTTANHFMMHKAGLVSFYGPSIIGEFAEYGEITPYVKEAIEQVLFQDSTGYQLKSSPVWSDHYIPWMESNQNVVREWKDDLKGHELLQGSGKVEGRLLGGCLDAFAIYIGTPVWPTLDQWRDTILFLETSEDKPGPEYIIWLLRNMAAQGILKVVKGILVGKPKDEVYYEEYKEAILQVVAKEEGLSNLPIIYNMNFGHSKPIGIIPYGILAEMDCDTREVRLLESATIE